MNQTFIPTFDYNKRKWYIIDCKGQKLGRLTSSIIALLSGKFKSYYHPSLDTGDYVILINAEALTINRNIQKLHVYSPGRPGHSLKKVVNALPQQIIQRCVYRMMPNGFAKTNLSKRLKIYVGPSHPHNAQNPVILEPKKFERSNSGYKI